MKCLHMVCISNMLFLNNIFTFITAIKQYPNWNPVGSFDYASCFDSESSDTVEKTTGIFNLKLFNIITYILLNSRYSKTRSLYHRSEM
jgi:hypothetical protein